MLKTLTYYDDYGMIVVNYKVLWHFMFRRMIFMKKDYLTDCVTDLLKYYNDRDFIQMAFAYDEIQMHKGLKMAADKTFFTEVLADNKILLSQVILNQVEYEGEPVLVSIQDKWKSISFDTMYEGAVLEDMPMPDDLITPVELITIPSNREITLHDKCVKVLDVKPGDIILISAMSEGFYITKFTEKDIKSFL